jgi:hypothetical protein
MEFTADQVWGAAAAADRINGGYFKESQLDEATNTVTRMANKTMVKNWLRGNYFAAVTEADYAAGRSARDHFKSYTLLALTGQINDFQKTAMQIASKDQFTGRDMYDFAVVSCLPEVARKDRARIETKREIYTSTQLTGNVGEAVAGDIVVESCRFNHNYAKYRVVARMAESFIDFWYGQELDSGKTYRVKGKIKTVRGDKTTQLNYVKISG